MAGRMLGTSLQIGLCKDIQGSLTSYVELCKVLQRAIRLNEALERAV